MKNPFKKEDHTATIVIVSLSAAVVAGTVAWLYLTDSGAKRRKQLKRSLKSTSIDRVSDSLNKNTKIIKKAFKEATNW